MRRAAICLLVAGWVALGQHTPEKDVLRIGPGIRSPKLIHKTEPSYSSAARDAHVQGLVLLQIVVDEKGLPQDITVLSPLGFGLDEKAIEAVSAWRFKPGEKGGWPVKIQATVEISFRFAGDAFDEKAEQRRMQFNAIMARIRKDPSTKPSEKEVAAIEDSAKHKSAAARYVLGKWQREGFGVPKDEAAGLANIQQAADLNFGPALYFVGKAQMEGDAVPKDFEKGLGLVRDAAVLGSVEAQYFLGESYAHGTGVELEVDRAKRYFRLCAAAGVAACQFRLGQLLMGGGAERKESDWVQGIAWWELAEGHGYGPAKGVAASEEAKLTQEQRDWVARLKGQLEWKD
jgi:TonB family protein